MITPEDRANIKEQLIELAGAELGKYNRSPLTDIPAIYIGKTTPSGYKMILSKQTDVVVKPGLEIILHPHQEFSRTPRNIQSRSQPDIWRVYLIYHEFRQLVENSLPQIIEFFSIPPQNVVHLPADRDRNLPDQYRLDMMWVPKKNL